MIEISGLTKTYPGRQGGRGGATTVLDGVDLHVDAGRIAAVVGPSGAGKSTLARCVNLLERPTSGSVVVEGQDLSRLRGRELRVARRRIGTVFQSANLLRRLTAAQNVALPLQQAGVTEAEQARRVGELLERVGLLHRANAYPAQLSGGQRQRIGIARGLALGPSVLLADEATSGLDPDATRSIVDLLVELRADLGLTVLVITHEMDVVRSVADVVARLDHGRIVEQGPVSELVRLSDSPLSRALLPLPDAVDVDGLRAWEVRYRSDRVAPTWPGRVGRELGSDVAVLAAIVEESAAVPVGRLTVGLDPHLDPRRVAEAFEANGLVAAPAVGLHALPAARESEPAA